MSLLALHRIAPALQKFFSSSTSQDKTVLPVRETDPTERDRLATITALSRAVRNDPDSVEIYMALGNLYRAQGDFERAVQLRKHLIVRPELSADVKARLYLELGHDYRRGGLIDRAMQCFEQAQKIEGLTPEITENMARLYAESGNFLQASNYFAKMGMKVPQAHYLVRASAEFLQNSDSGAKDEGRKLLRQALRAYNGSVEAWSALLCDELKQSNWTLGQKILQEALEIVPQDMRFLLFEELLLLPQSFAAPNTISPLIHPTLSDDMSPALPQADALHGQGQEFYSQCLSMLLPLLEAKQQSLLAQYYGAVFLQKSGNVEDARFRFIKALEIEPNFWAARLALLELGIPEKELSPAFLEHLQFFLEQIHNAKRFVCRHCGMSRNQTFYLCPRCHTWHSIGFRISLKD